MRINKVNFGEEILIDLTEDTVSENSLLSGYTAHNRAGELIEGLVVVPTKVSQLENDSDFVSANSPDFTGIPTAPTAEPGTSTQQIATTQFVTFAISQIPSGEFELIKVVQELPEIGEPNKIYLVPTNGGFENNRFNEFIWVNYEWEYVGAQELSLDGYVKETDIEEITTDDIKAMFGEVTENE